MWIFLLAHDQLAMSLKLETTPHSLLSKPKWSFIQAIHKGLIVLETNLKMEGVVRKIWILQLDNVQYWHLTLTSSEWSWDHVVVGCNHGQAFITMTVCLHSCFSLKQSNKLKTSHISHRVNRIWFDSYKNMYTYINHLLQWYCRQNQGALGKFGWFFGLYMIWM
jgi:hypothetical protein